jgi:heme A synthase
MEVLLESHRLEAYAMVFWMLLVGAWGVARHWSGRPQISVSYSRALWLAGALPVLQALLGAVLLVQGHWPDNVLHIFLYGTLAPLVLPVVYLYTQRRGFDHPALAFGLACLFQVAFLWRAISTA